MPAQYYAFGEILWDCLPSGRHPGGAPFNVCAHIAQLGYTAALISAVGSDPLGDEILDVAREKRVDIEFVTRARTGLPTGIVRATLDAAANATYEIVEPAAWDEIETPEAALEAVAGARALVYGSLAARSSRNIDRLNQLLAIPGPLKFFDVNLRPPFVDPARVITLARRADVIKLNDEEAGRIATWLRTGRMDGGPPDTIESLAGACATLAADTAVERICVTRGSNGAVLWDHGNLVAAPAPAVIVKDTVGAGDAFMAGLVIGLTQGFDPQRTLEQACRLGAHVASQSGATPILPPSLVTE